MTLAEYLAGIAGEMRLRSEAIRRDFATHKLSAGENREDLVRAFLVDHLPKRFGVSSGLVISTDGMFSNQADLLVTDQMNNSPLYAQSRNQLWPAEAIYALVEVKTNLAPTTLSDAVAKGRRFKSLPRQFCDCGMPQRLRDSLFVIWSFESSSPEVFKKNYIQAMADVPLLERPDLVVVPNGFVAQSGHYLEIAKTGQPGSPFRQALEAEQGQDLSAVVGEVEVFDLGDNSLLGWYVWFDSWLRQAGYRVSDPVRYIPPDRVFGRSV